MRAVNLTGNGSYDANDDNHLYSTIPIPARLHQSAPNKMNRTHRRRFLAASSASVVGAACLPGIVTAKRTDSQNVIGEGDYRYQVKHAWPELPQKYSWQTTHNVAVDAENNLYVIHEGVGGDRPSVDLCFR